MGGCYDARATPGRGVCREARGGACVEDHTSDGGRNGVQSSRAHDSTEGVERVRAAHCTNCEANSCNVLIGENTYCSKCSTTTEAPIDGVCKVISNDPSGCQAKSGSADGTCASCTGTNYFLHKGGCYAQTATPGSTICKTAGAAGICEACQAGYFKNPANVATSDSCIACNDATGVIVSGGATYKGVANCAACTAPAKAESGNQIATCTACVDGYYGAPTCTNQCDANCKSCTGAEATACTSCKPDNNPYFKKSDGETGECVAKDACTSTHFPTTDKTSQKKICTLCSDTSNGGVADCKTCSKSGNAVTCSACATDTKKPNADGTKCVDCAAVGCAKCSDEGVCLQCSTGKCLTPTGQCVDSCNKLGGYYADGNVCKPCSPSAPRAAQRGPTSV